MMPENYCCESPQDRRTRRHEEDKQENPERHHPTAKEFTRIESEDFCAWCAPDWQDDYEYNAQNDCYVRKA